MKKINLNFMVVPSFLKDRCTVANKVKIEILDPHSEHLKPYLGESGRTMAKSGAAFYFEGSIAQHLIDHGVAKRLDKKK